MAARSARARSKLQDKVTQSTGPIQLGPSSVSAPSSTIGAAGVSSPIAFGAYHNVSTSTSFNPATGLITPYSSSIATGSSGYSSTPHVHPGGGAGGGRHGFPFYNKSGSAARKSALRAIFEGQSEKIRGRLEDALRNKKSASASNSNSGFALGGSKKFGDIREERLLSVKRWDVGGKSGVAGWDKLQKDPELWLSDGDTLVYLSPHGHPSHQYSRPSFRIKSSVLRETESPFFNAILTDNKNLSFAPPPRTQLPPSVHRPPTPPSMPGSPMNMAFDTLEPLDRISSLAESIAGSCVSQTVSNTPSSGAEGIKYEIHFPAPVGLNKEQTHKYHLTTRNVFAVLFGKGLVGVTLGETLLDLVERMDAYIPPTSQPNEQHEPSSPTLEGARKRKNRPTDMEGKSGNVGRVLEYLLSREFDDVRNCPDVAAGILVFAEKFQLGELWREAFCHCVGMLNQMEEGKEYMEISTITKALIDRASLEIQVRTGYAEARLAKFSYEDVWPTSSYTFCPSKIAFERFQKFLIKHYQSRFGTWPPPPQKGSNAGGGWGFGLGGGNTGTGSFSRQIYLQLQRDFAALYDYLVDKDVSWEYPATGNTSPSSTASSGVSTTTLGGSSNLRNKPKMVSPTKKHFRADDDNLPLTDILIGFDRSNGFPHIPHPYPLVPELKGIPRQGTSGVAAMQNMAHQHSKHGFLGKRNLANSSSLSSSAMAAMDKAAALALSESTNIHSLLAHAASNELVDAFAKHEKERSSSEFTPAEGRKGRWILIYVVLQTLATVAGDAPGLKYTDRVEYFLNSKLKGTPPWVNGGLPAEEGLGGIDDHHTKSHCWTVVGTWNAGQNVRAVRDNRPQLLRSPVVSSTSTQSASLGTSGDMYGDTPMTSRSIGVGVGDTTDIEATYHSTRIHGGRKRKAIPRTFGAETGEDSTRPGRGDNMSGDEGDDEADEEDEDTVMGEGGGIPILEREADVQDEGIY